MKLLNSQCLCGKVQFEFPDELVYSGFCHCSECRKMTGSAFSASGGVALQKLKIIKGKEQLKRYAKNDNSDNYFCDCCGSFVYGIAKKYEMAFFMLGTLNEAPSLKPQWHIYTKYKAPWYEIQDDLPKYGEGLN